eukprot:4154305-Karenia_brevis.AAC.1
MKEALALKDVTPEKLSEWEGKSKYLHGLLMMLTEGETQNLVESCPRDGATAWRRLHDRWHKAQKMSSTVISEKIRSVAKSKNLDEVNTKLTELDKLYNEYYEARKE